MWALMRRCSERPGGHPVFRVPEPEREHDVRREGRGAVRSRHPLLKPTAAARRDDLHDALLTEPEHLAGDQRVTREAAEPRPHRCLKRESQRIPRAPQLDLRQARAVKARQFDPLGSPALAGPA